MAATSQKSFTQQLKKYYSFYTGGFILFVVALAIAEKMGMPNKWIGYCFLVFTILVKIATPILVGTFRAEGAPAPVEDPHPAAAPAA